MTKKLLTTMFMLLFVCTMSYAHPAKAVAPTYNPSTKMLSVNIVHTTTNKESHFIYKIVVKVNGDTVITKDNLASQDTNTGLKFSTLLPNVSKGDNITVETFCNRGGTKTATIKVPGKKMMDEKKTKKAIEKKEEKMKKKKKKETKTHGWF